ncbi:MAG: ParB/RepB/Spo0J family partition protein [Dehalococcoidia bacterium]
MSITRRKPDGPGFGHAGGSNLTDYLGASKRAHQIELDIEPGERLVEIPVERIDRSPYQSRATFDREEIAALGDDIQENGLNHPVTVREGAEGRYELVAGERRWLAARQAGLSHVTARVRPLDDFAAHLVGVSENNRRANLSAWEMSIEASRLLEHATKASRPHTQRDLARYLNRNVSIVNQQLAVAGAITTALVERTQVSEANVCRLPHVTLHRISKLPEAQRSRALKEAIRMLEGRRSSPDCGAQAIASPPSKNDAAESDDWKRLWETGGFHVRLRRPLRDMDPDQAERCAQQIAPALAGLATRILIGRHIKTVIQWENSQGKLLFVPDPKRMSDAELERARVYLQQLLDGLGTPVRLDTATAEAASGCARSL